MIARLQPVLALGVAVLGAALLLVRVGEAVQAVSHLSGGSTVTAESRQFDVFACRERQVHELVPRGARVFVIPTDVTQRQRLIEFVTGWAIPTDRRAGADVALDLRRGRSPCGDGLVVVRESP